MRPFIPHPALPRCHASQQWHYYASHYNGIFSSLTLHCHHVMPHNNGTFICLTLQWHFSMPHAALPPCHASHYNGHTTMALPPYTATLSCLTTMALLYASHYNDSVLRLTLQWHFSMPHTALPPCHASHHNGTFLCLTLHVRINSPHTTMALFYASHCTCALIVLTLSWHFSMPHIARAH